MATTQIRRAPENTVAAKPQNPRAAVGRDSSLEDRLDLITVRKARLIASKRNEKPISWQEFKKKIDE
jgi:hypothetical protein